MEHPNEIRTSCYMGTREQIREAEEGVRLVRRLAHEMAATTIHPEIHLFAYSPRSTLLEIGAIYPTRVEGAEEIVREFLFQVQQRIGVRWHPHRLHTLHPTKGMITMSASQRAEAESWGGPVDWDGEMRTGLLDRGYPADGLNEEVSILKIETSWEIVGSDGGLIRV
ncbi:hypothetical protein PARHAE_03275 [Paracoccus haematequi]|uniref:Uncharacterized protein n=1 Tax=Paracoccus haematequi TaxID=2491866 RepID=A0A447IRE5_9RHOB|nr:hypothetical protein [Paracoccus haematequi]VDS10064.1 hypothetical protein PARHAE_03275 [Paracoccus haematequi]